MKKLFNKVKNMNNTRRTVFEVCLVGAAFTLGGLAVLKCLEGSDD